MRRKKNDEINKRVFRIKHQNTDYHRTSNSMYEVFNWGYANDERRPCKKLQLSIAGPSINIDDPGSNNSNHGERESFTYFFVSFFFLKILFNPVWLRYNFFWFWLLCQNMLIKNAPFMIFLHWLVNYIYILIENLLSMICFFYPTDFYKLYTSLYFIHGILFINWINILLSKRLFWMWGYGRFLTLK